MKAIVFVVITSLPFIVVKGLHVNNLPRLIKQEIKFLGKDITKAKSERIKMFSKAKTILNKEIKLVRAYELTYYYHIQKLEYQKKIINDLSYFSSCTISHIFETLSKREAKMLGFLEKSEKLQVSCHDIPNCQTQVDDISDSLNTIHRSIPNILKKFNEDLKICVQTKMWELRNNWYKIITDSHEDEFPYNISNTTFLTCGVAGVAQIFWFLYTCR